MRSKNASAVSAAVLPRTSASSSRHQAWCRCDHTRSTEEATQHRRADAHRTSANRSRCRNESWSSSADSLSRHASSSARFCDAARLPCTTRMPADHKCLVSSAHAFPTYAPLLVAPHQAFNAEARRRNVVKIAHVDTCTLVAEVHVMQTDGRVGDHSRSTLQRTLLYSALAAGPCPCNMAARRGELPVGCTVGTPNVQHARCIAHSPLLSRSSIGQPASTSTETKEACPSSDATLSLATDTDTDTDTQTHRHTRTHRHTDTQTHVRPQPRRHSI